jgi:hypothetical protein
MAAPTFIESIGNTGYIGFAPETGGIGVPATPDDFALLDNETMQTMQNFEDQTPIAGNLMDTYQVLQGLRSHGGDITIVGEPNTAQYLTDMHLIRGTVISTYVFTITSATVGAGATYTNNGITFTVVNAVTSATTVIMTGAGAPLTSGTLTYVSGTPTGNITFSAAVNTTNQWPYTLAAPPTKSYTMDISIGGGLVKRFFGCMAETIAPSISKNQVLLKATISALGSFQGRAIASVSGSGPYTVTLKTDYTQNPTLGLVAGDLIRFYDASNNLVDTTVTAITNATQFTTAGSVSGFVAGDFVYLRSGTISLNILPPFLWSNMQWCYGATAAAALTNSQTRVEQTSTWESSWPFESKDGSQRSGNADPATLIRLTAQPTVTVKKAFGNPQDIADFNSLNKNALQVRMFSYSGTNTYEMRVTYNHLVTDSPVPSVAAKKVNYSTIKYKTQWDTVDNAGISITHVNALQTIS